MRILLLSNQPERTTRLMMFKATLESQGQQVIVPQFSSRGWLQIARETKQLLQRERPDVVHLFNVPDIIFHGLGKLKGSSYGKLIYDYRSPWGVELQMSFGPLARPAGEYFERELARAADAITAVNRPLAEKVMSYVPEKKKSLFIVNNYPTRSFLQKSRTSESSEADRKPIVFMGRISRQEGIGNLIRLIRDIPEQTFWIIGDGPFSRWYLRDLPKNARFFGWQPHDKVAGLISQARICLIPHSESLLTPYATDRSVWKLNEYLVMGKTVVASGVTLEEKRKNLVVVKREKLEEAVRDSLRREPEKLLDEDYRFWDRNDRTIREVYESL
ncbi:MAG: glycosyltransferase [Methanothrix sp.]|nr:glycosyltransferase [Methanothrix sp.]